MNLSRVQPESKLIQENGNRLNVLEMFLMRQKLGIKQDVSESDLLKFKGILFFA